MARVINYVMILAAVIILLAMFDVGHTNTAQLFQLFGKNTTVTSTSAADAMNPSDWSSGTFFNLLFGTAGIIALSTAIGAGIIATFIRGVSPESFIVAPIVGYLGGWFLGDTAIVLSSIKDDLGMFIFVYPFLLIMFAVWIIGFIIALIQWWRGNDII